MNSDRIDLLTPRLRQGRQDEQDSDITDPSFVILGEEVRAWKSPFRQK